MNNNYNLEKIIMGNSGYFENLNDEKWLALSNTTLQLYP